MSNEIDLPTMPVPAVENLHKASQEELVREFIDLRLYTAQLFLTLKDAIEGQKLPEGVQGRIATLEKTVEVLTHGGNTLIKHIQRVEETTGQLQRGIDRIDTRLTQISTTNDCLVERLEVVENTLKYGEKQ